MEKTNTVKIIFALLTAIVLLLTLSLTAVAEEEEAIWFFKDTGVKMTVPEKLTQIQGLLYPIEIGEFVSDQDIGCTTILYIPLSEEDRALVAQAKNNEPTEEQAARIMEVFNNTSELYSFFSVGNGKTFEDVQDVIFQNDSVDDYDVTELGQAGNYRFYLMTPKTDSERVQKSLAQFPESCRDKLLVLGTKSGRDMDKMKASGLEALDCAHGVTYREAELTLVCRKLYMDRLDPAKLEGELREKLYAHDAPHDMYIGEVTELIRP